MHLANYLICTHPRSGSNYLCELLSSTGKMGQPAEYFHEANLQNAGLSARNPTDLAKRFDWMMHNKASDNGVVGAKLFIFDLPQLASAGLLAKFAGFRFVFLQRRDKLSQAISIRKALKTGRLTSDHTTPDTPVDYDYADIRLRILRAIQAEKGWQAFFSANGINPMHCLYEDLAAEPQVIIDRIAASIGLPSGAAIDPKKLRLKVQRDATSNVWRDRFLAESAEQEPDLHNFCKARIVAADRPLASVGA